MANSYNYATNTQPLAGRYTKYMVSRVIDNPKNKLLQLEIPAEIPEKFVIELMFYSLDSSFLLSSVSLTEEDTDVVKVTTLSYADASVRRLLFIDFSSLSINIEQGRIQAVLNFFVPEVGGFNESKFSLTRISPSRKEVELSLTPQCTTEPTEKTSLSFDIVKAFLPAMESSKLNDQSSSAAYTASVEASVQQILNTTYNFASQSIEERLPETTRFTDAIISNIFSSSLSKAMQQYTNINKEFILV
jgi:hypothetical protein